MPLVQPLASKNIFLKCTTEFLDPKNMGIDTKMKLLGQFLAELCSNPPFSYGCTAAILKIEICGMKMLTDWANFWQGYYSYQTSPPKKEG